jgi:pSer/pThr/pTyr-binding forkhead associated (FHA) protein
MATPRPLALRFLSGRFQGGVVPIDSSRPMLLGRQQGSDLLLPEELVSRRHARLAYEGDELVLEDLGSTNGTYVNGVRVTRARVSEGDRILVGQSILKVVPREPAPTPSAEEVRAGLERASVTAEPRRAAAMQGRIEEVPLPDLLQLFGTSRKSGLLVVQGTGHAAEVRLEKGRVVGCVIDGREELAPEKSFYRLLGWKSGHFELKPAAAPVPGQRAISESIEGLLMEGMRQQDELRRLRDALPARFAVVAGGNEGLDPADRALLALAAQHGTLEGVLDAAQLPDLAAAERLEKLAQRGLLVAVR